MTRGPSKTSLVFVACGLLMTVSPSNAAEAQGWDGAAIGARISVRVADSLLPPGLARRNAIVGLVANREPQSLYVQITSDDTIRISRAAITRMYVSRGKSRRRSATELAILEGLIFTALPPVKGSYFGRDHFQAIGAAAIAGGMLGAVFPFEKWKRLRPSSQ